MSDSANPAIRSSETVQRPVAVVTGSSSGIGREVAIQLARQGFDVIVHAGRRLEKAEETAARVRELGAESLVLVCDYLLVSDGFAEFVSQAFAWRNSVSCWVNNAGGDVLTGEGKHWTFADKLDYLWKVDVRSTLLISRLVAEQMIQGSRPNLDTCIGNVVNIGWDQAISGLPGSSGQMFSCTKGAIMAMTSSLAKSYSPQVRFNCVAPGWIRTQWGEDADPAWDGLIAEQSLQKRWGSPVDVAGVVGFLASPAANYVNGQCLMVNGGLGNLSEPLRDRLL